MIDLLCHTKISGHSNNLFEVISLAKKNGITYLGTTTHDTTEDLEEVIRIGNELDVKVIPGIDISAGDFTHNKKTHIIGFHVTPGQSAISIFAIQ